MEPTNTITQNDWYISSDESDTGYITDNEKSSNSIFETETTYVSPELIRIFNLTPPLNDTSLIMPSNMVPYYITVYNPFADKYNTLGIIEGSVSSTELQLRFCQETIQIFQILYKRLGDDLWKQMQYLNFDDLINRYYIEKYTRNIPFSIHYFLNNEWRIFKYTQEMKTHIYKEFLDSISNVIDDKH